MISGVRSSTSAMSLIRILGGERALGLPGFEQRANSSLGTSAGIESVGAPSVMLPPRCGREARLPIARPPPTAVTGSRSSSMPRRNHAVCTGHLANPVPGFLQGFRLQHDQFTQRDTVRRATTWSTSASVSSTASRCRRSPRRDRRRRWRRAASGRGTQVRGTRRGAVAWNNTLPRAGHRSSGRLIASGSASTSGPSCGHGIAARTGRATVRPPEAMLRMAAVRSAPRSGRRNSLRTDSFGCWATIASAASVRARPSGAAGGRFLPAHGRFGTPGTVAPSRPRPGLRVRGERRRRVRPRGKHGDPDVVPNSCSTGRSAQQPRARPCRRRTRARPPGEVLEHAENVSSPTAAPQQESRPPRKPGVEEPDTRRCTPRTRSPPTTRRRRSWPVDRRACAAFE